jgi:hypothetical protein
MGEEKKCTRFWRESPKENDHSEDRSVDGRMRSEWEIGCGMEWSQLAQDMNRWRSVVNGSGAAEVVISSK